MASKSYMQGRMSFLKGGTRPQAMLWCNGPGTLEDGFWIPTATDGTEAIEGRDFIIISDHNRSEINMNQQRIETRQRMVNGNMRSYWIADKLNISTSWQKLPSRAFDSVPYFDTNGNISNETYQSYTVDGAAGGVDMLSWYENHPGPFYLFLAYDKFRINGTENYSRLGSYNQVIQVYFSNFEYTIDKRSANTTDGGFDFWNVNVSMEEV